MKLLNSFTLEKLSEKRHVTRSPFGIDDFINWYLSYNDDKFRKITLCCAVL